jgi:hypothetical protein
MEGANNNFWEERRKKWLKEISQLQERGSQYRKNDRTNGFHSNYRSS